MIPWWYTELGEEERSSLLNAFDSKRLTLSSSTREAEALFASLLKVPYAVMTNSGSSALLMALLALGIGPGDEVIVPSLTWIATPQAPALLGARVRLCDCSPNAPIIDLEHLDRITTAKTKAIIPVHLNGRECDMLAIRAIAAKSGAFVVEDACKALFSKGKEGFLGTLGDVGCYSLGMISQICVGYGGLVVTRNARTYEKLLKIRDHGVQRSPEEYPLLGFNFKISDLLASLAIPQLHAVPRKIERSIHLHDEYSTRIEHPDIKILPIDKKAGQVPIYVEAYSENRENLLAYLQAQGIQTSRYHLPTHRAAYLGAHEEFPNAERFARSSFILPSGPGQEPKAIAKVIETVNRFENLCGASI